MPAVSTQLNAFLLPAEKPAAAAPAGPGLFARLASALHDARMRQVDREIGAFIERRGGRMTDDLERQIERRFI